MSAQEGKAFDKPVSRHKIHDFVKVWGRRWRSCSIFVLENDDPAYRYPLA